MTARLISLVGLSAMLMAAAACGGGATPTAPPPVAANGPLAVESAVKIDLCHVTGNGAFRLINVSRSAEPAHRAHGDGEPGGAVPGMPGVVFDAECTPVAAQSTTFVGTFVGSGGVSGTIELTLPIEPESAAASAAALADTGSLAPMAIRPIGGQLRFVGGGFVLLTGTLDTETGAVVASGGGYTFTGTLGGGSLSGTFTGPSDGIFETINAAGDPVTTYCGTFDGDGIGLWMMQIADSGTAEIVGRNEVDELNFVGAGLLVGTSLTLQGTVGWSGMATGTVVNGVASGTWIGRDGYSGTWAGSTSGCQ